MKPNAVKKFPEQLNDNSISFKIAIYIVTHKYLLFVKYRRVLLFTTFGQVRIRSRIPLVKKSLLKVYFSILVNNHAPGYGSTFFPVPIQPNQCGDGSTTLLLGHSWRRLVQEPSIFYRPGPDPVCEAALHAGNWGGREDRTGPCGQVSLPTLITYFLARWVHSSTSTTNMLSKEVFHKATLNRVNICTNKNETLMRQIQKVKILRKIHTVIWGNTVLGV